jgi:phage-related baseplate assembly protein
MRRNPDYQYVSTDTEKLVGKLVSRYEEITGTTLRPASPEKLIVMWAASVVVQERVLNNYTGNQNIPSGAEGYNLDVLGELFYNVKRPAAKPAVATERFFLSAVRPSAVLIPVGTRVTDIAGKTVWETADDAYVPIGSLYADVKIGCQSSGVVGNGYEIGQINTLIDISNIPYFAKCENITESDGGSEKSDDDEYYMLMRAGSDAFSVAGPMGAYAYFAKSTSTEIGDVVANSPADGQVCIYTLMKDGTAAGEEIKTAVLAICNSDDKRPLTDYVVAADPETVSYDVKFTYYIPSNEPPGSSRIQDAVNEAVNDYTTWQCAKFGRDINPSHLEGLLMQTGIKRFVLDEPSFTALRDGRDGTVPQVATVGAVTVINGGYEDE